MVRIHLWLVFIMHIDGFHYFFRGDEASWICGKCHASRICLDVMESDWLYWDLLMVAEILHPQWCYEMPRSSPWIRVWNTSFPKMIFSSLLSPPPPNKKKKKNKKRIISEMTAIFFLGYYIFYAFYTFRNLTFCIHWSWRPSGRRYKLTVRGWPMKFMRFAAWSSILGLNTNKNRNDGRNNCIEDYARISSWVRMRSTLRKAIFFFEYNAILFHFNRMINIYGYFNCLSYIQ